MAAGSTRSSVAGETWPAEIEKAAAVWRSGGNADDPRSSDYAHLNGGDPAWAVHILTGKTPWYHWADADDTWSTIRSHCSGQRTTDPLVAWTWGSSDDSPNKVDYGDAHIAANHAYSILGHVGDQQPPVRDPAQPVGLVRGDAEQLRRHLDDSGELGQRTLDVARRRCLRTGDPHVREYYMGFGGAS